MGTRYVYSRQAVAPFPRHLHALVVFIVVIFSLFAMTEQSCRVEKCWQDKVASGVPENSTLAYCEVLRTLSACVRGTARSCRGDLKYHSLSTLLPQYMNYYNCSRYPIYPGNTTTSPMVTAKPPSTQCAFHGKTESQYCALFGDPHLHTFNNEQQTCKILKAWPLIDNAHLAVQVTNDAVLPGDNTATATTKVTVIIKGSDPNCALPKTYEAQVGSLPSAFVDGTATQGKDDEKYVRIKEKEPGRHVEIFVKYIATTVVIRQVGNYLTVAIQMPKAVVQEGVAEDGLQLCMKGCPVREQIDLVGFLRATESGADGGGVSVPGFTQKTAVDNCLNHDLTDFHFDACVFDLMTTGDYTFGDAARKAAIDQKNLNRHWMAKQMNRTTLPTGSGQPSNGSDGGSVRGDSNVAQGSAPGFGVSTTNHVTLMLLLLCWIAHVLSLSAP